MRSIAQRADIRDLILDGVDTLLAKFGYSKMTMQDLAVQVGIGKGTIYLHFSSKEEVVLAHIDRIAERILARMRGIAGGAEPPAERIRAMLRARVLGRFDSVLHYSRNLNDLLSAVRKGLLSRREAHFAREAEVLAGVIGDGLARGDFANADPVAASRALVWSTNSLLPFSLTPRELGRREEMEARVDDIAGLLLFGLLRRPGLGAE